MAVTITRLDPGKFLLRGYLKFHVYRSPATLAELKDPTQRTIGGIDADMLHSAVIDVVTRPIPNTLVLIPYGGSSVCLIPCGGINVSYHLL
ncbi:hypothetical protein CDAR_527151 [Caerostris darwini]|uniref:Uncharacterized protein n=1 Tax=Caerostris darwini TaxID=1538125 RepID=A0AAV4WJT9_9ARAC|nr:hypothetical protein CDAR_527151 [Caerostris darwini]